MTKAKAVTFAFNCEISSKKLSLNINKWIYGELINTKKLTEKYIQNQLF